MKLASPVSSMCAVLRHSTLICLLCCSAFAESGKTNIEKEMRDINTVYLDLRPILLSPNALADPKVKERVERDVRRIANEFHAVRKQDKRWDNDPGYQASLKLMRDTLRDVAGRIRGGHTEYVRWRLLSLESHCISCHTRFELVDPFPQNYSLPEGMSRFEKATALLAMGAYARAEKALVDASLVPTDDQTPIESMRALLTLYVRVLKDPVKAIATFKDIESKLKLSHDQSVEMHSWISSLEKWKPSSAKLDTKSAQERLETARHLLKQAGIYMPLRSRSTPVDQYSNHAVELLRATSILHEVLTKEKLPPAEAQEADFMLPLAYDSLDQFFPWEYTQYLYEKCIRRHPKGTYAEKCFNRWNDLLTLRSSGSSGVMLSEADKRKAAKLKKLAGI